MSPVSTDIRRGRAPLFFILYYLYVWLHVRPDLVYHAQQPVFFEGKAFLVDFLARPGGLTEYVGAFLLQLHYYPWAGALFVTAGAWLVYRLTRALTGVGGWRSSPGWPFIPPVLLLVLHSRYSYALHLDLALLGALLGALAYMRVPLRRVAARWCAFLVLSVLLWYTVAATYLLFAVLCGIYEAANARRRLLGLSYLACVPLAVLAHGAALQIVQADAWLLQFPYYDLYQSSGPVLLVTGALLYIFYPLAVGGEAIRQRLPGLSLLRPVAPRRGSDAASAVWALGFALLAVVPAFLLFDSDARALLELDRGARHAAWERVVEKGADLREYDVLAVYNIQQALYHVGELPERMFAFPVIANAPVISPNTLEPGSLAALSHILYELGSVNQAEHMAHEALEILGDRPSLLQRLVLINILKGRAPAARVFLGRLEKSSLYDKWVEHYRRALDSGSPLSGNAELSRISSLMPRSDSPGYLPAEVLLRLLLVQNPKNRMAFEYLMAHYLLTGQPEKIAEGIGHLNDYPEHYEYPTIPTHYEEAILLHMAGLRSQGGEDPQLPLHGRKIRPESLQRFEDFRRILRAHRDDRDAARRELAQSHGDTYWFYFAFSDPPPVQASAGPPPPVNPQQ